MGDPVQYFPPQTAPDDFLRRGFKQRVYFENEGPVIVRLGYFQDQAFTQPKACLPLYFAASETVEDTSSKSPCWRQ